MQSSRWLPLLPIFSLDCRPLFAFLSVLARNRPWRCFWCCRDTRTLWYIVWESRGLGLIRFVIGWFRQIYQFIIACYARFRLIARVNVRPMCGFIFSFRIIRLSNQSESNAFFFMLLTTITYIESSPLLSLSRFSYFILHPWWKNNRFSYH